MGRRHLLSSALCTEAQRAEKTAELRIREAQEADRDGDVERGDELRLDARRLRATSLACVDAAQDTRRCGRDLVAWRCIQGHTATHPYTCGRSMLCPECARRQAADRGLWYWGRAALLVARSKGSLRPRHLTCTLRTREGETDGEAYARLRAAWGPFYRAMFGRPHSKADWDVYWAAYPVTEGEIRRTALHTPAGRLRSRKAREREARARRRRGILADKRRANVGMVWGFEWGPERGSPHVHALTVGRFVPQQTLARAWRAATGNSYVVFIRLERDLRRGLREVVKYATKFEALPMERQAVIYRETLSVALADKRDTARSHRRIELGGKLRRQADIETAIKTEVPAGFVVCPTCGENMRPYGVVPESYARMGILDPPDECLFKSRGAAA